MSEKREPRRYARALLLGRVRTEPRSALPDDGGRDIDDADFARELPRIERGASRPPELGRELEVRNRCMGPIYARRWRRNMLAS